MSNNSLFKSNPFQSTVFTPTATTDPVTTTETTIVDQPVSLTSTIPQNLSHTPPAFFVGISDNKNSTHIEPISKETRSLSIGYGDRRLSSIFSAETPLTEKKKEESKTEMPKKRVNPDIIVPTRGIFGDGKIIKRSRADSITKSQIATQQDTLNDNTLNKTTSNTIKVFGYPTNLINTIIQHFIEYGKIQRYEQAPNNGNWILITYENSASALAALKSNGLAVSKNRLIGVTLYDTQPIVQRVIPLEEAEGLFKPIGLGSGKTGVSASDNQSTGKSTQAGFISYVKESIFGW